jgi:hypothetical protein
MKKNVDNTLLQRIQKLRESEAGKPKMSLEDVDVIEDPEYQSFNINKKGTDQWIGNFGYRPARIDVPETGGYVELPEFITMDMPYLEQPYRRRGIGEQMYRKIEEATGKKIIPDTELSDYSAALHAKKGMGKSFGKKEYGSDILKSLVQSLNKLGLAEPEKVAKKAYDAMKEKIQSKGVSEFKSILPLLGKGAAAAAGGFASLAAEAADSEEEGSKLEEDAMLREREEKMRRDNLRKMLGKEQASQAEESYEELTRPRQYKRLKDILK